jgi:hypothetical protein
MNPNLMNALKAAGAVAGAGALGFGAYKAVQSFTAKPQDSQQPQDAIAQSTPEAASQESVTSAFEQIDATQLESYPEFLSSAFPNLQIREGTVFELQSINYMLIEGTDTKFDDNPRPQAILFHLNGDKFEMVSSVTISGNQEAGYTASYGNPTPSHVNIGYQNGGAVQAFKGSGKDEAISNFNNDFVIAQ